MRRTIKRMQHFPSPRVHAYLDTEDIKALVDTIKPGLLVPGSLETVDGCWKLLVTLNGRNGENIHHAVIIHDAETVEWVQKRITENWRLWREERERSGTLITLVSDDYMGQDETTLNSCGGGHA